jgi:hypothetical protein
MEAIAFLLAVVLFIIFNMIRVVDNPKLRLSFFIPLIVAYVPFFIFSKEIKEI